MRSCRPQAGSAQACGSCRPQAGSAPRNPGSAQACAHVAEGGSALGSAHVAEGGSALGSAHVGRRPVALQGIPVALQGIPVALQGIPVAPKKPASARRSRNGRRSLPAWSIAPGRRQMQPEAAHAQCRVAAGMHLGRDGQKRQQRGEMPTQEQGRAFAGHGDPAPLAL